MAIKMYKCLCFLSFLVFASVLELSQQRTVANNAGSRIIGGSVAPISNYLWSAALNVTTNTGTHFCGGALINRKCVLTAAQCVLGATNIIIRLGSHRMNDHHENGMTLATEIYVIHPDYNPNTIENDIAVVRFHFEVNYNDYMQPILLPFNELEERASVTAVGWGQTTDSNTGFSEDLRFVQLTTLTNQECRRIFGGQIKDHMVCVAGNLNEGICRGDTGSALMQTTGPLNSQVHVGVASFMSGLGCETAHPSGFTRTFFYKDWILEHSKV